MRASCIRRRHGRGKSARAISPPTFFDIEIVGEGAPLKVNPEGVWLSRNQVLHSDSAWYDCRRSRFR